MGEGDGFSGQLLCAKEKIKSLSANLKSPRISRYVTWKNAMSPAVFFNILSYILTIKVHRRSRRMGDSEALAGVSNLWPTGSLQPGMTVKAAQHKIINLFKTF